jgi:hypothetical protein
MTGASNLISSRRQWPIYASFLTTLGMLTCFAAILIQFFTWLFSPLDAHGVVIACSLGVLEAFVSFWLIKHLPTAQKQIAYYRATEVILILIALKFFIELRTGVAGLWNNMLLWPENFPFTILNKNYFLAVLPVLATWLIGNRFAVDLFRLSTEDDIPLDEHSQDSPMRSRILRRFLNLGMVVIILAGIPPQVAIATPLPVTANVVPAVVAYFVLGIILLSLTRYISLETSWWQARLQVPVQIPRRWFAYSAVILTILVLLIIWLPTYYGMGFIETINAVFQIMYLIFTTIYTFILVVFSLLSQLFLKTPESTQESVPEIAPTPLPSTPSNINMLDWNLVKSIFLWGSLIILVIVALRQYISFNKDLSEDLRQFRPLHWLFVAWDRLKAALKKVNSSVGKFIQDSLKRVRSITPTPDKTGEWNFINPRRLSSRQKVIFYYLALIRRAREAGLPRQDGQTPYEYAHSLKANLNAENEGVDAMTSSFIEARYSRHEIPPKEARRMEHIWENIGRLLRNIRRSRQEEKTKIN